MEMTKKIYLETLKSVLGLSILHYCRQITFVTLNGFCPLSNPTPHPTPPVLNGQNEDGRNIIQNQMKNAHPLYIVFEVLKVHLIKICEMQPLNLLFLVMLDFISADIVFTSFQSFIQHYLKKDFCHNFSFFNGFTQPPLPALSPQPPT